MPTSQDLVPTDQPYGARQDFVEAATHLGVPLSTTAGGAAAPGSPSARPVQPGIIPPNYDVFANREPSPPEAGLPVTADDLRRQRLLEHPNPLWRDLAQRILT